MFPPAEQNQTGGSEFTLIRCQETFQEMPNLETMFGDQLMECDDDECLFKLKPEKVVESFVEPE